MPREGTLRADKRRWRPIRQSLVAWRPIGWLRGRVFVWGDAPVLEVVPDPCRHPGWSPAAPGPWSTHRRRVSSRAPGRQPLGKGGMDGVFPHGAGVDGHQQTVRACRGTPEPLGQQADGRMEGLEGGPLTRDVLALSDGLTEAGVSHIVMERPGASWEPVYTLRAGSCPRFWVKAAQGETGPGRQTERAAALWLAQRRWHG
jgi:hypothetical protein